MIVYIYSSITDNVHQATKIIIILLLIQFFSTVPASNGSIEDNFANAMDAKLGTNFGTLQTEWDGYYFIFRANLTETYEFNLYTTPDKHFKIQVYEKSISIGDRLSNYTEIHADTNSIVLSSREAYYIHIYSIEGKGDFNLDIKHYNEPNDVYTHLQPALFHLGVNYINTSHVEAGIYGKFKADPEKYYQFKVISISYDGEISAYISNGLYSVESHYKNYKNYTRAAYIQGSNNLLDIGISVIGKFNHYEVALNITDVGAIPEGSAEDNAIDLTTTNNITGVVAANPIDSVWTQVFVTLPKVGETPYLVRIDLSSVVENVQLYSKLMAFRDGFYYGNDLISLNRFEAESVDKGSLFIPADAQTQTNNVTILIRFKAMNTQPLNYTISLQQVENPKHATITDAVVLSDKSQNFKVTYPGQPFWMVYSTEKNIVQDFIISDRTSWMTIDVLTQDEDYILRRTTPEFKILGGGSSIYIRVMPYDNGSFTITHNYGTMLGTSQEVFSSEFQAGDYLEWSVSSYRNGMPTTVKEDPIFFDGATIRVKSRYSSPSRLDTMSLLSLFSVTINGKNTPISSIEFPSGLLFPVEVNTPDQSNVGHEVIDNLFGHENVAVRDGNYVINRTSVDKSYYFKQYLQDYWRINQESNYMLEHKQVFYYLGDNYTITYQLTGSKLSGTFIISEGDSSHKQTGEAPISVKAVNAFPADYPITIAIIIISLSYGKRRKITTKNLKS